MGGTSALFVAPTLLSGAPPSPPPTPLSPAKSDQLSGFFDGAGNRCTLRCSHTLWCPRPHLPTSPPPHHPVISQIGPVVRFLRELSGGNRCTLRCSHTALWCPPHISPPPRHLPVTSQIGPVVKFLRELSGGQPKPNRTLLGF